MAQGDETTPNTGKRSRIPTGVRIVLFVSLALNLAVVGIVAGFIIRGGPNAGPPRHVRDAVAPYTAALSREDRRDIGRQIYRDLRGDGSRGDLRAKTRADYAEALQLLRDDPFDAAAFGAHLSQQNARAAARQIKGQDVLVAHISAMSAAERVAYADRVAEALTKFGRKRR